MGTGGSDLGKFLLRLAVGGMLLLHGIGKIEHGVSGIEGMLEGKDLPTWLAYGAYVGEVLGPALLLVGFKTRLAGLMVIANMGMAVWLAHWGDLAVRAPHGGWAIELPMFYLLGALCIMLIGPGAMSVDGRPRTP